MGSGIRNLVIVCLCLGAVVAVLLPAVQRAREAARTTHSRNNLKQLGLALHNYHDVYVTFPPGAVADADGRLYHGWQTSIFPYIEASPYYNMIDFDYPWDDPYNLPVFRVDPPLFRNPSIADRRDEHGLPSTHYSVSSRLFGPNSRSPIQEIEDKSEATILGGEIGAGFPAWGRPGNWRDPGDGLRSSPNSFGVAWREVNMLMVDGSVRELRKTIDPELLEALSTPAGGEPVPSEF